MTHPSPYLQQMARDNENEDGLEPRSSPLSTVERSTFLNFNFSLLTAAIPERQRGGMCLLLVPNMVNQQQKGGAHHTTTIHHHLLTTPIPEQQQRQQKGRRTNLKYARIFVHLSESTDHPTE
jgi:hypothetical protein